MTTVSAQRSSVDLAQRAAGFLGPLARAGGCPLRARLQALFGLSGAAHLHPAVMTEAASLSEVVAPDLHEAQARDDPELRSVPSHLLEICSLWLEQCAGMPAIRVSPSAFAASSTTSVVERLWSGAGDPASSTLLYTRPQMEALCNGVSLECALGLRPPRVGLSTTAADELAVILLQKLREYDLLLGADLLRILSYLMPGALTPDAAWARDFLLAQQDGRGAIGYYAQEISASGRSLDWDVELRLPTTVSVLWAVLSAEGQWRWPAALASLS